MAELVNQFEALKVKRKLSRCSGCDLSDASCFPMLGVPKGTVRVPYSLLAMPAIAPVK